MKSLLVNPPFTKGEWAAARVRDLGRGPLGRRLTQYLTCYADAVVGQRQERVNALLEQAGLPGGSPEDFTLHHLARALSRLATRDAYGVDHLEQLLAVNRFVEYLTAHDDVWLDPRTRAWAERCQEVALVTLIVCVNRHFGYGRGGETT
jgi:hypothetical protein